MLENINTALQAHYTTATGARSIWDTTRAEIEKNYIGNMKTERLNTGKEIFEQTLADSRWNTFTSCSATLAAVKDEVNEVITAPVDEDFTATLEALKAIKAPSEAEVNALMNKFKGNYFAHRALCDYLGGAVKGYKVVTVDEMNELLLTLEASLRKAIYGSVNDYSYQNLLNGSIIASYDGIFSAFTEGRFEDVAEAIKAEATEDAE